MPFRLTGRRDAWMLWRTAHQFAHLKQPARGLTANHEPLTSKRRRNHGGPSASCASPSDKKWPNFAERPEVLKCNGKGGPESKWRFDVAASGVNGERRW